MIFHFINKQAYAVFSLFCMQRKGHNTMDPKITSHKLVYDPGVIKLDHLESTNPVFEKWFFTLLPSQMQHFPISCMQREERNTMDPKIPKGA